MKTRAVSTRGVPSSVCGFSFCWHLVVLVQLLPVSFHSVLRVLVDLSPLLIVSVANVLATLRCVFLAVSASQERKQRGTAFVRDTVGVHFHLADVRTGSALQEAVSTTSQESDRPRENVAADNEVRALCVNGRRSLAIHCSCACQRLLHFCTSSRFGKFVSVSSLGFVWRSTPLRRHCAV